MKYFIYGMAILGVGMLIYAFVSDRLPKEEEEDSEPTETGVE